MDTEDQFGFFQYILSTLTWSNILFYSSLILISWIVYKFTVQPFLSPLRKVPGLPYNPIFGNMKFMLSGEAMESHIKLVEKYGNYVRYYFILGVDRLLVADPAGMKRVLVTNYKNYEKPRCNIKFMVLLLREGLVMSEGATHAMHKKLMSPAFNNRSINNMLPIFKERAKQLVRYWTDRLVIDEAINVHNDLARVTLDVIGETAFGYEFDSLGHQDFYLGNIFHEILSGHFLSYSIPLFFPFYTDLPLPGVRKFKKNIEFVRNFVQDIINAKRKRLQSGSGDCVITNDVLGMMMMARDENTGEGMTDEELTDQVVTLMIAGHETTAVALSWCLLMLSTHKQVQEKLRDEVSSVVNGNQHFPATLEDLDKLEYCDCVVKETLRLYPPVPFTIRVAKNDDIFDGQYKINRGTLVTLSLGAMMRRADLYEDPHDFKPERFLGHDEGRDVSNDNKSTFQSFLPFIIGPRMCLGYKFALAEFKIMVAYLVSNFNFELLEDGMIYKRKIGITMRPEPPLRLKLSPVVRS